MDYVYNVIQILALFLSTLWFFTWLCERRNGPGRLFELKRQYAAHWISGRKRTPDDGSADATERLIDGVPRKQCESNIVSYFGADLKNNFIFVKINHRRGEQAELTLFLSLRDGRTYELPDHPNCVVSDSGSSSWSGAGLKISVLESRRRARIVFNGLLRRGARTDISRDDDEADIEHVRFNCIFIASTRPYPQEEFWSSELQAEMFARNSWKKSRWHQLIRQLDIEGIDQYGSMIGQVTFEDSSNVELYLRTLRQCQWGRCDASHFERNIRITGLDSLGTIFYINLGDVKDGLKNMHLGHVKYPTDILSPINSITFDAKHFTDRFENGFDEYEFEFIAGTRKYEAILKLRRKDGRILYGGYPWNCQYAYYNFDLILNDTPGVGMIELWQPYSGACPVKLSPLKRFIKARECGECLQAYTVQFQDKRCQNESYVGGKGASLAELSSMETTQFSVPKGFCVTTLALESHIKSNTDLTEAIDDFVKVCTEEKIGSLKEHSQIVVKLLENTPVLQSVRAEILEAFEQVSVENATYAVRSSAVGEDSEDTSAAGQNSTFLGVKSPEEVVKCVARCWASLYTHQSVQYRRQHGMPVKAAMGVCVQQMVDAEAAGVMFTRHPITGNPKEILITSNYGLGEAVVSALVDPDTLIVQRGPKNSLSLKSSTIGKKSQKISVSAESETGGTRCSDLSSQESSKLSISPELALRLAEIGDTLDRLYGAPRDVEWAVSKDRIYLLQCRPVTALDAWTDFELTHELGSGVAFDEDILTFANVGEVLSMVLTPLSASSIVHGMNVGTEFVVSKKLDQQTYASHLFIVNMRCCLNYMNLMLRFVEDKITLGNRVMDIAVSGRLVLTPEIHATAMKRNGKPSDKLVLLLDMLRTLWDNSKQMKLVASLTERWKAVESRKDVSSPRELHRQLGDMIADLGRIGAGHSVTSSCSVFYQVVSMSILAEGKEDLTMEHYSDIAVLLGSASDVISAQVPVALKEITRTIKKNGLSEQFKAVDLPEAMSWLRLNCPRAYEQVQEFIKVHGHRGIDEFELITETWGMRPEKFLATVQAMMNSSDSDDVSGNELSPREAVGQLKTPRKSTTRWLLRCILPLTRQAVARRESTKALVVKMVHYIRLTYLQLADSLVRQGRLPERGLIFFLTHQEVAEVIEGPCPGLLRKAARRRKLRSALQKHRYKELNYGMPKPIEPTEAFKPSGTLMQGTSVCNGIVTGRACVALTLEEAAEIRAGDILITMATDIGWSPYFPLLGGVVTELGGLISHGAVVAREYGLPCIVGVENATRTFKTGDTVTLNGYAGTIETVEEVVEKVVEEDV